MIDKERLRRRLYPDPVLAELVAQWQREWIDLQIESVDTSKAPTHFSGMATK